MMKENNSVSQKNVQNIFLTYKVIYIHGFQIVFDEMAAICPDFKCLGFQISDPIWNPDHLQPNVFWTIQNPD